MDLTRVAILCLVSAMLNFPFGYYRMGVRKYSWRWFLAIHLPIPLLLAFRLGLDVGWQAIPFVFAFAIAGQLAGGRSRKSST